jgi:hypothetical protein
VPYVPECTPKRFNIIEGHVVRHGKPAGRYDTAIQPENRIVFERLDPEEASTFAKHLTQLTDHATMVAVKHDRPEKDNIEGTVFETQVMSIHLYPGEILQMLQTHRGDIDRNDLSIERTQAFPISSVSHADGKNAPVRDPCQFAEQVPIDDLQKVIVPIKPAQVPGIPVSIKKILNLQANHLPQGSPNGQIPED